MKRKNYILLIVGSMCLIMCNSQNICPKIIVDEEIEGSIFHIKQTSSGFYPIVYIGDWVNQINIDRETENRYSIQGRYFEERNKVNSPTNSNIQILVDTTEIISNPIIRILFLSKTHFVNHISYPVLVRNKSETVVNIGYGNHLNLIAEIQDTNLNWKPIEVVHKYACGTGIGQTHMKENEIAVTMMPLFDGESRGKMRLRLGKAVSNEFLSNYDINQIGNILNAIN